MDDFRRELAALVDGEDSHRRAELRVLVDAVLAAGMQSRSELAAVVLDRSAGAHREQACSLLQRMTDEAAQDAWIALLRDPDASWRSRALSALDACSRAASLRPERAAPALIAIVRADPDAHVRAHAALVLGACAPASDDAMDVLLAILTDVTEAPPIRGAAAEALHRYPDVRAAHALIAALDDAQPEIRYYTAFALSARRETAALPALERVAATEQAVMPPPLGSVRDELLAAIEHIRRGPYGPPWR